MCYILQGNNLFRGVMRLSCRESDRWIVAVRSRRPKYSRLYDYLGYSGHTHMWVYVAWQTFRSLGNSPPFSRVPKAHLCLENTFISLSCLSEPINITEEMATDNISFRCIFILKRGYYLLLPWYFLGTVVHITVIGNT